jgi:hypothetical protein
MLLQNHQSIHVFLNQHFSIKDCVKMFPLCAEFKGLKSVAKKEECYRELMNKCSEEVRNTIIKKKYFGYINKAMLLIDARLNEEPTSNLLEEDEKVILKKLPVLVRATVMVALQRST